MEAIALLANHDPQRLLDATFGMKTEDRACPRQTRSLQRQRRLSAQEASKLGDRYREGATVNELAQEFRIHRTTVLAQLERQDVKRRSSVRRLTDADVANAALSYKQGMSLKVVGAMFGVNAETLRREFRKANVPVRQRNGWT